MEGCKKNDFFPICLQEKTLRINKAMISGRVLGLFFKGFISFQLFVKSEHQSIFESLLFQDLRFQNMATDFS